MLSSNNSNKRQVLTKCSPAER